MLGERDGEQERAHLPTGNTHVSLWSLPGGMLTLCCQISLEKLKIQTVSRNLPVFKHLLKLCRSRKRNVVEERGSPASVSTR